MSNSEQSPTRLEIRPRQGAVGLVVFGLVATFYSGTYGISHGRPVLGWLLIIAVVALAVYFVPKMIRRKVSFVLTPEGLYYDTLHGSVLIGWDTIEQVGTVWRYTHRWVGIRLHSYDEYLANMPDRFARFLTRFLPIVKCFNFVFGFYSSKLYSTLTKLWYAMEGSPDPEAAMKNLGRVADVASLLAWSRQTYGYDIVFNWTELDRSAGSFVTLLEQWRKKYGTGR